MAPKGVVGDEARKLLTDIIMAVTTYAQLYSK